MTDLQKLCEFYKEYIAVPWRQGEAPPQRVIFCIYDPEQERSLRVRISEFELATTQTNHSWALYDATDTFPRWLSNHNYKKGYFQNPDLISSVSSKIIDFIITDFSDFLSHENNDENTVVAIKGIGTLYGFLKIHSLIDCLAPLVPGRLLIFFPGSYEKNNYRFLNGVDGRDYHAVPITDYR